jgi:hypothetical protein
VKPADISGIKQREYLGDKINELAMISKNKNIRDLYRGINDVDWVGLAKDRNRWRAVVNSVLNLRVP